MATGTGTFTRTTGSGWNWGTTWGEATVEEEDEEMEPSGSFFSGRDGLVFLMDCSKGMFTAKDQEKAIELSIKVALNRSLLHLH